MNSWIKWTLLEAMTRTTSKLLQKIIGFIGATLGHVLYATAVIGGLQVIVSGILLARKKVSIFKDKRGIAGSIAFGFFAFLGTVLSFLVFVKGGDVGVNTFIVTLAIIPAAFIDWIFFHNKLSSKQWFGVLLGLLAGYFVLDCPSMTRLAHLPLWIWISIATALGVAINQGITQMIRKTDAMVMNFWGGGTTFILALVCMILLGENAKVFSSDQFIKLTISSLAIGLIIILMWMFNIIAYRDGARIAEKKLVMNGAFLVTTMLLGLILFGEQISVWKFIGIAIYLFSFRLIKK